MKPDTAPDYERHTREYYQDPAVAQKYARRQTLLGSPIGWTIGRLERHGIRRAMASIRCEKPSSVLDVPCGAGKLADLLRDAGSFYVGVDVSQEMLMLLGPTSARARGDAAALGIRDSGVDLVVCLRLLHRVPEDVFRRIVVELLRVSERGVVLSYAGPPRSTRLHRLLQTVTRRGVWNLTMGPDALAAIVAETGGGVLYDRSISLGLTSERIAAVVRT